MLRIEVGKKYQQPNQAYDQSYYEIVAKVPASLMVIPASPEKEVYLGIAHVIVSPGRGGSSYAYAVCVDNEGWVYQGGSRQQFKLIREYFPPVEFEMWIKDSEHPIIKGEEDLTSAGYRLVKMKSSS